MTNQIVAQVPVVQGQIGGVLVQTVSARDLHTFLEVGSEFRNWIKNRIDKFGFVQDVDFIAGNFLPGSDRVDYHITIDMAKELSMVERTPKGKEARQYFLDCERRLHHPQLQTPEQQAAAAMAAWDQLGAIFGAPKHITLQEGTKAVMARYGVDLSPLMLASPHNDAIQDEEVFLEPTDLGKLFGLSGQGMNLWLFEQGLQTKVAGEWRPTEAGRPLCVRHAWTTTFKSGYNLKWKASAIEQMMHREAA